MATATLTEQSAMKLYSYIVVSDYGFAPNPFQGMCTLAACTPNHIGIKAKKDDWIVGFEDARRGHNLLYAMRIEQVLHFNDYHSKEEFQAKIPRKSDDWRDLCGDNLYFLDESGKWDRVESHFHKKWELFAKDTKHPHVFIAKHFYYFGDQSIESPQKFKSLIFARQGCKSKHDPDVVGGFISWLESTYRPGVAADAEPRDSAVVRSLLGGKEENMTPVPLFL
jgi:hypothetical protein